MHAARSGNAMALSEVVEACQSACEPRTVRRRERDACFFKPLLSLRGSYVFVLGQA